jgi:very-short-patch-repair endonuclease
VVLSTTKLTQPSPEPTHIKRNSKNYFELPYNPKLKDRARALRKAGNLAEVLFWLEVKNKKFKGLDFDRQKIIGNYIVDFYCANVNVVVEIDGSSHDNKQEYDAKRDAYLQSLGLTVIHITDGDVKKNMEYTLRELKAHPAFDLTNLVEEGEEHTRGDVDDAHATDHPVRILR